MIRDKTWTWKYTWIGVDRDKVRRFGRDYGCGKSSGQKLSLWGIGCRDGAVY